MPDFVDINQKINSDGSIAYEFDGNVKANSLSLKESSSGDVGVDNRLEWQDGANTPKGWIAGQSGAIWVGSGVDPGGRAPLSAQLIASDSSSSGFVRRSFTTPRKIATYASSPVSPGAVQDVFTVASTTLPVATPIWKKYSISVTFYVNVMGLFYLDTALETDNPSSAPTVISGRALGSLMTGYQTFKTEFLIYGGAYNNFITNRARLRIRLNNTSAGNLDILQDPNYTYVLEESIG